MAFRSRRSALCVTTSPYASAICFSARDGGQRCALRNGVSPGVLAPLTFENRT
jgi:hypothetical protein